MRHAISITQSPEPAVVQGAYKWLCITEMQGAELHLGDIVVLPERARPTDEAVFFQYTLAYSQLFSRTLQITVPTDPPVEDWMKFQRLVEEWKKERGVMSSITEAALCDAYQSIIGMGEKGVPFILEQLKLEGDDPDQWFWALSAITGADPIKDDDRGDYFKMAQAWLQWAETSEYCKHDKVMYVGW